MTDKKTYESKMTDIDAKIKALRKQKKKLQKDHEVKDLKLKVKSQSEQIAQLTADNQALTADNQELKADNQELKAKLSDTDMQTVPFPADDKLKKLEKEKANLEQKLAYNRQKYSVLNNRYSTALRVLRSFGSQYGFDPEPNILSIRAIGTDSDSSEK